jgi:hypothetical protein
MNVNPTYKIELSKAKMSAVLRFNQQDNGDRINKHPKNQIITENNNKFGDRTMIIGTSNRNFKV